MIDSFIRKKYVVNPAYIDPFFIHIAFFSGSVGATTIGKMSICRMTIDQKMPSLALTETDALDSVFNHKIVTLNLCPVYCK